MKTNKETAIEALTKLVEQGKVSNDDKRGSSGFCRYRLHVENSKVLKCGVGHLITDEEYNPSMEGKTVRDVILHYGILDDYPYEILRVIQNFHDTLSAKKFPEYMQKSYFKECLYKVLATDEDFVESVIENCSTKAFFSERE